MLHNEKLHNLSSSIDRVIKSGRKRCTGHILGKWKIRDAYKKFNGKTSRRQTTF
jgi:hypothetical protein